MFIRSDFVPASNKPSFLVPRYTKRFVDYSFVEEMDGRCNKGVTEFASIWDAGY